MFGVCAAFTDPAFAQSAQTIKNSPDWARASVVTDGAAVYTKTDFDAPVVGYLSFKSPIWVTKKPVPGTGGLGLFHRVRFKDKAGYMADTDIRISGKEIEKEKEKEKTPENSKAANAKPEKQPKSKAWEEEEESTGRGKDPLFFSRYLGVAASRVNFTEKFSGKRLSDQMLMYGLRMTGPGVLFDGPPLDFNFWFSMQKPSYYSKLTDTSASGFLLFGDVMAVLPLIEGKKTLLYFGLGLMWTYTNYKVTAKNSHFDSQEFRVGADLGLGVAQKFGRYCARLDTKYYYEKTAYVGFIGSFQMEY